MKIVFENQNQKNKPGTRNYMESPYFQGEVLTPSSFRVVFKTNTLTDFEISGYFHGFSMVFTTFHRSH